MEEERVAVRHARLNCSLAVFLRSVARAGVDGVAVLEAIVADAVDVLKWRRLSLGQTMIGFGPD